MRVEVELESKVGLGMAGLRNLRSHWQSHGEHNQARRVVLEHVLPHDKRLRSLCGDTQRGQPKRVHAFFVDARETNGVPTRDAQLKTAVVRSVGGDQTS